MSANDKKIKHFKISVKNIIMFIVIVLAILYGFIFYNYHYAKSVVFADEGGGYENIEISNADFINVDDIISNNQKDKIKEEIFVEQQELEYITKYNDNSMVPKGRIQVLQEGRQGVQEIIKKKTYKGDKLIEEKQIGSRIVKGSVNKIVEIGTGAYYKPSKVKVGDNLFVTSYQASVREEPQDFSNKVTTLNKDSKMVVLDVPNKDWFKISSSGNIGYIRSECTTNVDNTKKEEAIDYGGDNISPLKFDMALNKPSGLSLEQFKKVLTDNKDKNKVFENNYKYFYYIEKQYNINGLFVASVGIHESAWGTSKISKDKHNLFGYGAYDSNPYNGAYNFSDYSESIDLIARVFTKYYLNPKGTPIYGGEKAVGTYYNGPTLSGINKRYATDKNWANGVFRHMKYLYNKL